MSRDTDRFFVLTGGPGSGKTTLIERLGDRGVPDVVGQLRLLGLPLPAPMTKAAEVFRYPPSRPDRAAVAGRLRAQAGFRRGQADLSSSCARPMRTSATS